MACGAAVLASVVSCLAASAVAPRVDVNPVAYFAPSPGLSPPVAHHGVTRNSVLLGVAFPSRDDYRFQAGVDGARGGRRACLAVYASGVTRASLIGVPLSAPDLEAIEAVKGFAAEGGQASGTAELRADCMTHYELFCSRVGAVPYESWTPDNSDALEALVLRYLRYEAGAWGVGYSHLNNKRLAIRDKYDLLDRSVNPLPLMRQVTTFMRRYRKACGSAVHKLEVEPDDLRLLLSRLDLSVPRDLMLWAAVLFAFMFLARLSEFCVGEVWALSACHLTFYDAAGAVVPWSSPTVAEVEVFFRGSKNDQERQGAYRSQYVTGGDPDWCIVRVLARVLLLKSGEPASSPLFAWGRSGGGNIRRTQVTNAVKDAAVLNGKPRAEVSAHSLRSGGASAMMRASVSYDEIQAFGRWRSDVAKIYARSNHQQMQGVAARMIAAQGVRVHQTGPSAWAVAVGRRDGTDQFRV